MKSLFKTFFIGLLLVGAISSCTDSTLLIDELYNTVDTNAAFIRTIEKPRDLVTLTDTTRNKIEALIEIQAGNGSYEPDFKEVRLYTQTFNDQDQEFPTLDTSGNPLTESLLSTFPASDFYPGPNTGLPTSRFSVPTQTILDNNPTAVFTIPTFIFVRLELEMNDGTVYTNTNVGPGVSSGNYFLASFAYNIIFLNI
jgi:hypothetical protein